VQADPQKKKKSVLEAYHHKLSQTLVRMQTHINIPPMSEMLDEVCLYVQRTVQLLWLLYKVALFSKEATAQLKSQLL
jgi:hypothetical protein